MEKDDAATHPSEGARSLTRAQFGGGRLGTYTVLGGVTGVVPLPWLPGLVAKRVRGALVHDLVSRHGLSVTPEARKILVEGAETSHDYLKMGASFAVGRVLGRLGPLALLGPVRSAFSTFVLGHLLERYLDTARSTRSVRIDVDEARRVRRAIDQALVYALTTEGKDAPEDRPFGPEDLRDSTTQLIDGVLLSAASMPGWILRRLDAAFDETLASVHA